MPKLSLRAVSTDPRLRRQEEIEEERIEAAIAREGGFYSRPRYGLHGQPGPLNGVDLSQPMAPPLWLVDDMFQRESLILVGGPPGGGKTWYAMALARALALAEPFLGHEVEDLNKVLYLDFENGAGLLHQRFSQLGVPPTFRGALRAATLDRKITDEECWRNVLQEIEIFEPDVVVIDTFASAASVDENDVRAVEAFYERVWEPLRRRGCSVVLLHHTRKQSRGETGVDRFRGSGHIVGRVDRAILVDRTSVGGLLVTDAKARQHAPLGKMTLGLVTPPGRPDGLALEVAAAPAASVKAPKRDTKAEICATLSAAPMGARGLAAALAISESAVNKHLSAMVASGALTKTGTQYAVQ